MTEIAILLTALIPIIIIFMRRSWLKKIEDRLRRQRGGEDAREGRKKKDIKKWTKGWDDMR